MCGIVGYCGKPVLAKKIVQVLKKLEYRGYDSSGIAGFSSKGYCCFKALSEICNLEKVLPKSQKFCCAIAHTRWATHGKPTIKNAHPHLAGKWAIVHNGIIENAKKLCDLNHIDTDAQTDTELLAQFLSKTTDAEIGDFVHAFQKVQGSYAIVAQNQKMPNTLFLAKNKSPLYAAVDENQNFLVASDPICFENFAKKYYSLADNEFAIISNKKIIFYNKSAKKIIKKLISTSNENNFSNKEGYLHFMLKEIFEQPKAILKQIDSYKKQKSLFMFDQKFLNCFDFAHFVGCGSAFHACQIGANLFEEILGFPSKAEVASEFLVNPKTHSFKKTLFVLVSQSGETADTLLAQDMIKKHGGKCLVITNVLYSTLAQKSDFCLGLYAGPEVAVASTKAYVCQLCALYALAMRFKGKSPKKIFDDLSSVSDSILSFDMQKLDEIAKRIALKQNVVFVGKGLDFITAREAALKVQEISYINALAVPAGELKHGYLAIIEENTPVFVFATNKDLCSKTLHAAQEASSRGGDVFLVSPFCEDIKISSFSKYLMPILAIAPMQYLAYKVSAEKKLNPDKPRNLAKSVTVE